MFKPPPSIDAEALLRRVRQELELPPRVVPPAARSPLATPAEPPAPPVVASLKQRLRRLPLLGPLLGMGNRLQRRLGVGSRLRAVPGFLQGVRWLKSLLLLQRSRRQLVELGLRSGDLAREVDALQATAAELVRRIDIQEDQLRRAGREIDRLRGQAGAAPAVAVAPDSGAFDSFYIAFEDRFRGDRADIKRRLGVHLERVRRSGAGARGRPIVDLGCGRGEWLELIAEAGLDGYGIDRNERVAAYCRQAGLMVRHEDAVAHLRSLPAGAVGAVTAFHLVEHLPFEALLALLDEIRRVLAPGGIVVLETPNPENLQVGAHTFHIDPTHRQPLPPAMLEFVVRQCGFPDTEILRLHPFPEADQLPEDDELARRFNRLLLGPQDYAVIGRRP